MDIICGDHLLERYQTLREIRRAIGDAAMQVGLPYLCLTGKLINERGVFCVIRVLINIIIKIIWTINNKANVYWMLTVCQVLF